MMTRASLVCLTLRGDDGEERVVEANVELASDQSVPSAVSLWRAVAGEVSELDAAQVLDEVCAAFEQWCEREVVEPVDHRAGFAAVLGLEPASHYPSVMGKAPELLGTPPLQFPAKGSGARGKRSLAELPPIPDAGSLTEPSRAAQRCLRLMVERSGGRLDPARQRIATEHLEVLADLMAEWATHYGERVDGGIRFNPYGRGGWYAFDRLVPLQDPNRWDPLRLDVFQHLEHSRGWARISKSAPWWIPDPVGGSSASASSAS